MPFVNRWFFAEVIATVEGALRHAGFDLLLYNLGDADGRARSSTSCRCASASTACSIASLVLDDAEFAALTELNRPVGLLGLQRDRVPLRPHRRRRGGPRARSSICSQLGHRRIGLIGGDTDDPMAFTPPLHRRVGYRDALRRGRIEPDPALELLGYFTVDGGRGGCPRLARAARPADRDLRRERRDGLRRVAGDPRAGLRVPEDVAVIGFDDQPLSELMDLSTVRQPVAEQAADVTTRLLALIAERPRPSRDTTRRRAAHRADRARQHRSGRAPAA